MTTIAATEIEELAVVELTHSIDGFPAGAVGTIVSAHPAQDAYVVEFADAQGRTVELLPCHSDDVRLAHL